MLWVLFLLLPCIHARCIYRPPQVLVPEDLILGAQNGLNMDGVFQSLALFDWSKATADYTYTVLESIPASAATNASLGATRAQTDPFTTLAVFTRDPEEHIERDVLEHFERYRIVISVASVCAPTMFVTQATYHINLTATYDFTHNFTGAYANLTTDGWKPEPQLVMHPDVERYLEYVVRITQTHFIRVRSGVNISGGANGICAGSNDYGEPCYATLNVSIVRDTTNVNESYLEPLSISYALSQFTIMDLNLNRTFNDTKPSNFNVSNNCSVPYNDDYRYDICEGSIDTAGNVSTRARHSDVVQNHSTSFDSISATCTYRLFADECHNSPVSFIIGWFTYDFVNPFEQYHNHSLLGSNLHTFMT